MNMYSDEPIDSFTSDYLERGEFARNLALALSAGDVPIHTISLIGKWGCGKTSVINLVKKQLQETGINIIDFNPWKIADRTNQNDLIRPFLEKFVYSINAYLTRKCLDSKGASERQYWKKERKYFLKITASYSSSFMTMAEVRDGILTNLASGGNIFAQITAPIARYIFGFLIKNNTTSIAEDEKAINNFLLDNDIHNLIIIDDIDRLTPDETLQLFRIVREIASFKNTVHLLCFDKVAVAESLQAAKIPKPNEYIEKIANSECLLSYPPHSDITSIVRSGLADVANDYNVTDTIAPCRDGNRFEGAVYAISDLLLTLRDVKRYMNILILNKNVVCRKGVFALNFVDFIIMECIREKRIECYNGIYKNKAKLTMTQDAKNKTENDTLAETKDELYKLHGGDETLLTLLRLLFPVAYRGELPWHYDIETSVRICYADEFEIYFRLNVADVDNEHVILVELLDFIDQQDSKQGMIGYLRELQKQSTKNKFSHFLDKLYDVCRSESFVNKECAAHFGAAMLDLDANGNYSERCYIIAKKYLDAFANDFFAGKNNVLTTLIKETDDVASLTRYIANAVDIFVANNRGMKDYYKTIANDIIILCLEKIKAQPSSTILLDKRTYSLWNDVLKLIMNLYYIKDVDDFVQELERVADKETAPLVKDIYDKAINKSNGNNVHFIGADFGFGNYGVIKTFYDRLDAQLASGKINAFDKGIVNIVFLHITYGRMESNGGFASSYQTTTFSDMTRKYGEKWDNLQAYLYRFYGGKDT